MRCKIAKSTTHKFLSKDSFTKLFIRDIGKRDGLPHTLLTTLEAQWMQKLKIIRITKVVILKVGTVEWDIKVETSAHDFVHLNKIQ